MAIFVKPTRSPSAPLSSHRDYRVPVNQPANQFDARRRIVSAGLADHKVDSLIVSFGPNLRYLSGFTGSNGTLLVTQDDAILFTDPRYDIQARQEVSCQVKISRNHLAKDVLAAMARLKLKRVGFEPARMTCEYHEFLKDKLKMGVSLEPVKGWIEEIRSVKSPAELALIRQSVETNSLAFDQAVKRARPGMKEQDLAAEIEYRMRRLGAEKPSFETIVAGGVRSALPHAQPTAARLDGGLVVVDMGAVQDGYCSDMTRMLHIGRPSPKTKATYRAVIEAQLAAIDAVRPGVSSIQVDRAARDVLKSHGLDKAFVHSTGHGLGIEIHEPPRIARHDKVKLASGMAITIEPGVYLEGFGGIRIEDTVVVTANGCEILTPTSKELRVI